MEKKYLILIVLILIAVGVFAVPLTIIGLIYAATIPIALIYSFNAEAWLDMHGTPFSYGRAFKYGLMGGFYIHNYYHEAFRTYSLDIFDESNVSFKEQLPDTSILVEPDSSFNDKYNKLM